MLDEIFSAYPRIAQRVYLEPWGIKALAFEAITKRLESFVMGDRTYEANTAHRPSPESAESALNARLIGGVDPRPTFATSTAQASAHANADRPDWMVNYDNRRAAVPYNMDRRNMIGQVLVSGIIGKGLSSFDMSCGGVCVDHIEGAMRHLGELGARAVALHFSTPGGVCTGVPECAEFIAQFNASVAPVHAYTDTMCCSCGYYLAAGASTFTAARTADIGCIGVYCYLVDRSGEFEKEGKKAILLASGKFKGQGAPGVPIAEEFIAHLRGEVDALFAGFAGHIVDHRGEAISAEAGKKGRRAEAWANEIMQGQSWLASEAPRGLFDGYFANRVAHMTWLGGLR